MINWIFNYVPISVIVVNAMIGWKRQHTYCFVSSDGIVEPHKIFLLAEIMTFVGEIKGDQEHQVTKLSR